MPVIDNSNRTKKEIEAVSEKMKKTRLSISDVVIPIAVAMVLILLGIFVFVPMIKAAIDFRSEYSEVLSKEKQLTDLERTLNAMDEGILQSDLVNARKVIPNTLKVSSFMYYIDNLATQKGLTSSEISVGDIKISTEGETSDGSYILGVSGPMAYEGTLSNLLSFLDSLYSTSPYILTIKNLDLEKSSNDKWKISMSVTGYYVPETSVKVNIYSVFKPYTSYPEVVSIFETKSNQLN